MKNTFKFSTLEEATAKMINVIKSLPHEVTKLNEVGEVRFTATSPIDNGYVVVCGGIDLTHDHKFNKVWTLTTYQGM